MEKEQRTNVLKVKADPRDISQPDRAKAIRSLGGAISHGLRTSGEVYVRAFGPSAVYKATKGIATARSFVASMGYDLYSAIYFITSEIEGEEKTGICFLCVTSSLDKENVGRMIKVLQAMGYEVSPPDGLSHPAFQN